MTKSAETSSDQKWKPILLIFLFAILALAPALVAGVPASRDLQHHFRLALWFNQSFGQNDFYPAWLGEANHDYGDVSLRFYPPGLAFSLAAVRALTGDWYVTALIVFTLLTLLGGLGTYLWAKSFYDWRLAVWAAGIFIFMPYRANELYQSSLLAEYAAAAVLPFVFAFTERICRKGSQREVAGLAASYALLVLTNLPMTIIGSYAVVIYLLLRLDRQRLLATLSQFGAGIALGLAASACFWVTVVAELSWLRPDNESAFSRANFIFASFRPQAGDTSIWYGNLLVFATIAITLPAIVLFWRKDGKRETWITRLAIFAAFSLIMSTIISLPLWEILPKLKDVQLPWRWLAVTSAASAVLVAGSIPKWREIAMSDRRPLALLAAGAVLMSVAFTVSHPMREANYISSYRLRQVVDTVQGMPTIGPWYPKWVADQFLVMPQQVVAGERTVKVDKWLSEHRTFQVSAGAATDAKVHAFYYPLWSATAAGKTLPTRNDQDGTLIISLPPEAVTVDLAFREPLRSRISGIVSVIGWAIVLVVALLPRRDRKLKGAGRS